MINLLKKHYNFICYGNNILKREKQFKNIINLLIKNHIYYYIYEDTILKNNKFIKYKLKHLKKHKGYIIFNIKNKKNIQLYKEIILKYNLNFILIDNSFKQDYFSLSLLNNCILKKL